MRPNVWTTETIFVLQVDKSWAPHSYQPLVCVCGGAPVSRSRESISFIIIIFKRTFYCLGGEMLVRRERSSLASFFFCLHKLNKQTDLKGQHNLYCFIVFICGRLCHLTSFKQCSGNYFPLRTDCSFTDGNKYFRVFISTSFIV